MRHLIKSFIVLILLTSIIASRTFAQNFYIFDPLKINMEIAKEQRAREVIQDNEYTDTGYEKGIFSCNPLMLDGKPLAYSEFRLWSKGELTVNKGAPVTGQATQVPFYVYLRRSGKKILIPGKEKPDPKQLKIDLSEVLKLAQPGDHLVIEAVNKEDGPVKRILKLIGGC